MVFDIFPKVSIIYEYCTDKKRHGKKNYAVVRDRRLGEIDTQLLCDIVVTFPFTIVKMKPPLPSICI